MSSEPGFYLQSFKSLTGVSDRFGANGARTRDGRNQCDFMLHAMSSISCLCRAASSLARAPFGDTIKASLLDLASVSLFDRHDVAVDTQLLADARQMPESAD